MKILITGACGFIGRQLIAELQSRRHSLRLLDMTRPEDATIFRGGGERARCDFGAIGTVNEGEDCQHGVADEFEHFNRHGFAPRPSWRRNNL